MAAHHLLHRLRQHFPVRFQVGGEAPRVRLQLVEAAQAGGIREQRVAERGADVALRRRVRQVALPARHRQLVGEMAQQRVGDPHIALRVLEVDRVHLVRHGRGADLALSQLLGEVAERDVAPGVAVEIEQHAVGARVGVEQLGEPVVRLDLRRVGVELEAQALDEAPAEALPVEGRISHQVGVVVADRAVDFPEDCDAGNALARAAQAVREIGQLLAQSGGRRRLPVGARQHRQRGVPAGKLAQRGDDPVELRQHHPVARFGDHERVGQVVDVLRRAGEVHELDRSLHFAVGGELGLQPVLDRLDVVVGLGLDVLDVLGVALREILDQPAEGRFRGAGKRLQLADRPLGGERLEPGELDPEPVADKRLLAEVPAQGIGGPGVPAVERRQRGERRGHGALL